MPRKRMERGQILQLCGVFAVCINPFFFHMLKCYHRLFFRNSLKIYRVYYTLKFSINPLFIFIPLFIILAKNTQNKFRPIGGIEIGRTTWGFIKYYCVNYKCSSTNYIRNLMVLSIMVWQFLITAQSIWLAVNMPVLIYYFDVF